MKRIACGVMVIALCVSLAFMPASASDFTLEIFGNANMDDTIDDNDIKYVEGIIEGTNEETELADANYDGEIDEEDIAQIELIICGEEKEPTLIDSLDRIVTVKMPINRAVVCVRNLLEILQTIQVENDQIAGITVGSNTDYNELFLSEYIGLPVVGSSSWNLASVESMLSLYPDVVLLNRATQLDSTSEVLESAGIPVLRFYGGTYSKDVVKETKALGYVFNKKDEADEFLDWYADIMNPIKEIVDEIPKGDRLKVYYESSHEQYYGLSEESAHVGDAGGTNIFPDGMNINPEAVVAQNPDIIVIAAGCTAGYFLDADDTIELKKIRDEMMTRPELQSVAAVKSGRVYVINGYMLSSMGCSSGRGYLQIPYLAKWFHTDLFGDLDPQSIHQEYLTKFRRLDYDLNEKGVFVYPPLEEC